MNLTTINILNQPAREKPIHQHLLCDLCGKPATRRETVEVAPGKYVTAYVCRSCKVK